uniref:Cu/Zn superoxide dismutase n=1 Tax=Phakopsora pachyrhizi TaxID=170000 RepID=A0A0S1MJM9_PHAPC
MQTVRKISLIFIFLVKSFVNSYPQLTSTGPAGSISPSLILANPSFNSMLHSTPIQNPTTSVNPLNPTPSATPQNLPTAINTQISSATPNTQSSPTTTNNQNSQLQNNQNILIPNQISTKPSPSLPHARSVIVSPNSGPVNGIIDFFYLNENEVGVSLVISGLNIVLPHIEHNYHVHAHALPIDGNCDGALGHYTTQGIPDSFVCNPEQSQLCQEGDLSGKHKKLSGNLPVVRLSYSDKYLKLFPDNQSIVGKSVVIHGQNGSRLACGNITVVTGPIV